MRHEEKSVKKGRQKRGERVRTRHWPLRAAVVFLLWFLEYARLAAQLTATTAYFVDFPAWPGRTGPHHRHSYSHEAQAWSDTWAIQSVVDGYGCVAT
jgi:hypothetical protein